MIPKSSAGGKVSSHQGSVPQRVVLLHCSASCARQWRSLTEELGNGFTAIPVDFYGHGNCATWRGLGPLTLNAEASAIPGTVGDAETPFHLVGHSYGGGVALRFALSYPEQLRSLVLIEPSCFHLLKYGRDEAFLLDEIRSVATAVNDAVVCGDYYAGMEVFIDYWNGAGTWAKLPEDQKTEFANKAVQVGHHFWSLIEEQTPLAAYAGIEVPTLILCGTRSPKPSRAITRLIAETLPQAKHRTIRGANHMAPITHSPLVNSLIIEHLAKSSRTEFCGGFSRVGACHGTPAYRAPMVPG